MRWRSVVLKTSPRAACMARVSICLILAGVMGDASVQCRDLEVSSSSADPHLGDLRYLGLQWIG